MTVVVPAWSAPVQVMAPPAFMLISPAVALTAAPVMPWPAVTAFKVEPPAAKMVLPMMESVSAVTWMSPASPRMPVVLSLVKADVVVRLDRSGCRRW